MKKFNLPLISDSTLIFIALFSISLILLTPIKIAFFVKIILSIVISLCIIFFYVSFYLKKSKNKSLTKKHKEEYEKFANNLEIMPDNGVIALLIEYLTTFKITAKVKENQLETDDANIFFNFDKLTKREEIAKFVKMSQNKKTIIFLTNQSEESKELVSSLKNKIYIVTSYQLFDKLYIKNENISAIRQEKIQEATPPLKLEKIQEATPPLKLEKIPLKQKFLIRTKKLAKMFTKKRAKTLIFSGGILLLYSYFTFYPIYYRIFAFILFILSAIFLIFGKKQDKNIKSIVDFLSENNEDIQSQV